MIALLLYLAFFSLIVWIIVTYIAKSDPIRTIIIAIAAICAILFIMSAIGFVDMPLPEVEDERTPLSHHAFLA